jgi:hypothetical protein
MLPRNLSTASQAIAALYFDTYFVCDVAPINKTIQAK